MLSPPFLLKAQEALKAAQLLIDHDYHNSAVNRAYYAMFHAARAVLVALRVSSPDSDWTHRGLQSAFGGLIQRRKSSLSHLKGYLSEVYSMREEADYHEDMVNLKEARRVMRKAQEFVQAIEGELQK